MKKDLVLFSNKRIFKEIKLFRQDIDFFFDIVQYLKYYYGMENEIIYRLGDNIEEIYFIIEGKINLYN
jgi:hypothetical protein